MEAWRPEIAQQCRQDGESRAIPGLQGGSRGGEGGERDVTVVSCRSGDPLTSTSGSPVR